MAEHLGKMIECDRCGKTVFLKHTGTTLDGGWSRIDNFEKRPEGWGYHADKELGLLCPECESAYQDMLDEFFDR